PNGSLRPEVEEDIAGDRCALALYPALGVRAVDGALKIAHHDLTGRTAHISGAELPNVLRIIDVFRSAGCQRLARASHILFARDTTSSERHCGQTQSGDEAHRCHDLFHLESPFSPRPCGQGSLVPPSNDGVQLPRCDLMSHLNWTILRLQRMALFR